MNGASEHGCHQDQERSEKQAHDMSEGRREHRTTRRSGKTTGASMVWRQNIVMRECNPKKRKVY
ncbi:MAG TPA: hypothetical protein PLV96_02335 [Methanoregulaceae archaeon]|nr:hypothetical protein [Methanoregulaceae archaeon]HQA79617.1 hypothetical protein [Methanoregulaceae archaeon]